MSNNIDSCAELVWASTRLQMAMAMPWWSRARRKSISLSLSETQQALAKFLALVVECNKKDGLR